MKHNINDLMTDPFFQTILRALRSEEIYTLDEKSKLLELLSRLIEGNLEFASGLQNALQENKKKDLKKKMELIKCFREALFGNIDSFKGEGGNA